MRLNYSRPAARSRRRVATRLMAARAVGTGFFVLGGLVAGARAAPLAPRWAAWPPGQGVDVQPAVRQALADAPRADVIVALRLSTDDAGSDAMSNVGPGVASGSAWDASAQAGSGAALHAATADERPRLAAVREAQASALEGVPDGGLLVRYRYEAIAGLAGSINIQGLKALEANPAVAAVALDPVVRPMVGENVSFIGADKVWRQGYEGDGVRVAVFDTGVDATSLDLKDAVVLEKCMVTPASLCPPAPHEAADAEGHGTGVAGIVASRGKRAPQGVAPKSEIMAVKLMELRADQFEGSVLLAALDWAATRDDIDVINMSIGSGGYEGDCDKADAFTRDLASAMGVLHRKGVVLVAASGNDGYVNKMSAPACIAAVISVGAVQDYDTDLPKFATFTNRSDTLDLLAPGAAVETVGLKGSVQTNFTGTSAAAPHVSGAVALLHQAAPWAGPDLLEAVLKQNGGLPYYRYGTKTIPTIRVDAALRALLRTTPTPTGAAATATGTATATLAGTATGTAPPSASPTATATGTATGAAAGTATAPASPATPPTQASASPSAPTAPTASPTPTPAVTQVPGQGARLFLPVARRP